MPKKRTLAKLVKKTVKKAARKTTKKVARPAKPAAVKVKKRTRIPPPANTPALPGASKNPPAPLIRKPVEPLAPQPSLGRPLVTQEEKLYMLFHDDYQCRQVFEFLRVETIRELEEFTPQQIVHLMSRPIRTTVDRIRQRLALFKRSLKDDEQFAAEHRQDPKSRGNDTTRRE